MLKCQLSVDSFVVCLFIFKREREKHMNNWNFCKAGGEIIERSVFKE